MEIDKFTNTERDGLIIDAQRLLLHARKQLRLRWPASPSTRSGIATQPGRHPDAGAAERAAGLGIHRPFRLTTRSIHWFRERGRIPEVEDSPVERQRFYNWQRLPVSLVSRPLGNSIDLCACHRQFCSLRTGLTAIQTKVFVEHARHPSQVAAPEERALPRQPSKSITQCPGNRVRSSAETRRVTSTPPTRLRAGTSAVIGGHSTPRPTWARVRDGPGRSASGRSSRSSAILPSSHFARRNRDFQTLRQEWRNEPDQCRQRLSGTSASPTPRPQKPSCAADVQCCR